MGRRRGERGENADKKGMRSRTDTHRLGETRDAGEEGAGCKVSLPHASSRLSTPHASLLYLAVKTPDSGWVLGMRAGRRDWRVRRGCGGYVESGGAEETRLNQG